MIFSEQRSSGLFALMYLSALAIMLTFAFKYPPLADYVEWIYQSYILTNLLQGVSNTNFYVRDYPVPYVASQLMMAALNNFTGPIWSAKIVILIYLALAAWLSKKFIARHGLDPQITYPLILCCIVCNSSFWSGYINYQLGLLTILAYLGLPEKSQSKMWINAFFSLAVFCCHGFCLMAFFIIAGIRALTQGWPSVFKFSAALLPTFLLTIWYVLARNNDAMPPFENPASYFSLKFLAYKIYTLTKAGPYHNFIINFGGDFERARLVYYLGIAANSAIAIYLVRLTKSAFKRARNTSLTIAAGILGIAYIFTPSLASQVVNPGERLLYPLLLCIFALGLQKNQSEAALKHKKVITLVLYIFMTANVANLYSATVNQGNDHIDKLKTTDTQINYFKIMYWHRPYQFKVKYEYIKNSYENGTPPLWKIYFPTSLVANKIHESK